MLLLKHIFFVVVFLCCLFKKKRGTGHHICPIAHMLVRVQLGGSVPSFLGLWRPNSGHQAWQLYPPCHLAGPFFNVFNLGTRTHNLSRARRDSTTTVPLRPQLMFVRNCRCQEKLSHEFTQFIVSSLPFPYFQLSFTIMN